MMALQCTVVVQRSWKLLLSASLLMLACDGSSALVLGRSTLPPILAGSGGTGFDEPDAAPSQGAGAAGVAGADSGGDRSSDAGSDWIPTTCTPEVVYDNRDAQGSGALFDQYVADPTALVHEVAHTACSLLYRHPSEVPPVPMLSLIIEDFDGLAASSGTSVHISSRYLQQLADGGEDLLTEIHGLLYFTVTIHYQNDSNDTAPIWLVTGIADWVRLRAGHTDSTLREAGGSPQDGYKTTAFFLDWLNLQYADFVYDLNVLLGPTGAPMFMDTIFSDLTGKNVDALWLDYQATL
jgi:hypothetical protein